MCANVYIFFSRVFLWVAKNRFWKKKFLQKTTYFAKSDKKKLHLPLFSWFFFSHLLELKKKSLKKPDRMRFFFFHFLQKWGEKSAQIDYDRILNFFCTFLKSERLKFELKKKIFRFVILTIFLEGSFFLMIGKKKKIEILL